MEYVNSKYIANLYSISQRQIQRKAEAFLSMNMEGVLFENSYKVRKDLVHLFAPIYKQVVAKPKEFKINLEEWNWFSDFVPDEYTPVKVLKAVMDELFKHIRKETKQFCRIYYVIEKQPKASLHVHFYIKSTISKKQLKSIVKERLAILNLCDQYHERFMNDIILNTTEYINKGKKVNYKNSVFIYGEILTAGVRKN